MHARHLIRYVISSSGWSFILIQVILDALGLILQMFLVVIYGIILLLNVNKAKYKAPQNINLGG